MSGLELGVDHPLVLALLPLALLPALVALRRFRSTRARLSSLARSLALAAGVLALAGLVGLRERHGLAVMLVVDDSRSVAGAGTRAAEALRRAAREQLAEGDRLGVVVFGGNASVDAEPAEPARSHSIASTVDGDASDPASALALAEALLPEASERRIVLVSDGRETRGSARRRAELAGARDLRVDAWPVGGGEIDEAMLTELVVPRRVAEGETFPVEVLARSTRAQRVTVRLVIEDTPFGSRPLSLAEDTPARATFRVRAGASGSFRVKAYLDPELDTYARNNALATFVRVAGEPRVLHLTARPADPAPAIRALRASGLSVRSVGAGDVPDSLVELSPYAAVVLDDLPATELSDSALAALGDYVRELGGGLVAIGGEESFAPGGYYQTPVEEALPVSMSLRGQSQRAPVSVVLALDKSGSMGGVGMGRSKMDLAKAAALSVIELLGPRDRIGVIAFDSAARAVSPLGPIDSGAEARRRLATIQAGGGTDFTPALDEAYRQLRGEDTAVRHVLLLTDGYSTAGAFEDMARDAARVGITTSSVGVGGDADAMTLRALARRGGGNFYSATDVYRLPRIFVRETMLMARTHIVEEPFAPALAAGDALTAPLDAPLATISAYVSTTLKDRSTQHLVSHRDEPLLASWRYGLGRAVAFTSDAGAAWSTAWATRSDYAAFWSGLVRWALRDDDSPGLRPSLAVDGDALDIEVDAYRPDGSFRNFARLEARVFPPEGTGRTLPLEQRAPGRYAARLEDGAWSGALVQIRRLEDDGETVAESHVLPAPAVAPAELRAFGADGPALVELTAASGGRVLADAREAFEHDLEPSHERLPLRWHLLAAALALLLVDVAMRRVELGGAALSRATGNVAGRLPAGLRMRPRRREPPPTVESAASEAPAPPEEQSEARAAPRAPEEMDYSERLLAAKRRSRERDR